MTSRSGMGDACYIAQMFELFLLLSLSLVAGTFLMTGDLDLVLGVIIALLVCWVSYFMDTWLLAFLFFYPAWREFRRDS